MGARDKKLENRFRFRTFSEQIADISADIVHQVSLVRSETPQHGHDTFFYGELQKWSDLNLSQHYTDFVSELGGDVQSFAQLIHRKDAITAIVLKHLAVADTLALEPLLALLVALARDLRADFHGTCVQHALPLLYQLVSAVGSGGAAEQRAGRLQAVFTCLAHLFKLQWRSLAADPAAACRLYLRLACAGGGGSSGGGGSRGQLADYVVRFAAESFAYVCRKTRDKRRFFTLLYNQLHEHQQHQAAIGRLLFETIRGVRGALHMDTERVLAVQMALISEAGGGALLRHSSQLLYECVSSALTAACYHVMDRPQAAAPLWSSLWKSACEDGGDRPVPTSVECSSRLLLQLARHGGGRLLPPRAAAATAAHCRRLLSRLRLLCADASVTADQLIGCQSAVVQLLAVVMTTSTAAHQLSIEHVVQLAEQVFSCQLDTRVVLVEFACRVFDHAAFDVHLLPLLLTYVAQQCGRATHSRPLAERVLCRLLVQHKCRPALLSGGTAGACDGSDGSDNIGAVYLLDFSGAATQSAGETVRRSCRLTAGQDAASRTNTERHTNSSSWLCDNIAARLKSACSAVEADPGAAVGDDEAGLLRALVLCVHVRSSEADMSSCSAALLDSVGQLWHATLRQIGDAMAAAAAEWHCDTENVSSDYHGESPCLTAQLSRVQLSPRCQVMSVNGGGSGADSSALDRLLTRLVVLTDSFTGLARGGGGGSTWHGPHWRHVLPLLSQLTDSCQLLRCLDQLLLTATDGSAEDSMDVDGSAAAAQPLTVRVFAAIGHNLASPRHKVRLLTSHILATCERMDSGRSACLATTAQDGVFATCLRAELLPVDVASYKERVRLLQLLDASRSCVSSPALSTAPLLYLLGNLHVQFRLLWAPCLDLLLNHCAALERRHFVDAWRVVLTNAADAVERNDQSPAGCHGETPATAASISSLSRQSSLDEADDQPCLVTASVERLSGASASTQDTRDRVDLDNYRLLLWQLTARLVVWLQPHAVDLPAQLFLRFLSNEFYKQDLSVAQYQDLTASLPPRLQKKQQGESDETHMSADNPLDITHNQAQDSTMPSIESGGARDSPTDDPRDWLVQGDDASPLPQPPSKRAPKSRTRGRQPSAGVERKRGIIEVLRAHMLVLSKMTHLRRCSCSSQLLAAFTRFLTHKRVDVQRSALDCLLAFKVRAVDHYKDMLYSLMDESNFKGRLTSLSADIQGGCIQLEHRPHVLPILNRVLYGRMRASAGGGAASRDGGAARRRAVASFLAGCSADEITAFVRLCVDFVDDLANDNAASSSSDSQEQLLPLVSGVVASAGGGGRGGGVLQRAVPLLRLQSAGLLMSAVLARLGRLLDPCLHAAVLRPLLLMCAHTAALLSAAAAVDGAGGVLISPPHLRTLKKIRQLLMSSVCEVFERFSERQWSCDEAGAALTACVWPYIDSLVTDYSGAAAVTGPLKLLLIWAQHDRLSVLLGASRTHRTTVTPVSELVRLLNAPACQPVVRTAIVQALGKMLVEKPAVQMAAESVSQSLDVFVAGMQDIRPEDMSRAVAASQTTPLLKYLRSRIKQHQQSPGASASLTTHEMALLSSLCALHSPDCTSAITGGGAAHAEFAGNAAEMAALLVPVLLAGASAAAAGDGVRQRRSLQVLVQLLRVASQPAALIRGITPLFSRVVSCESRRLVVQCVGEVGARVPAVSPLASLVQQLNAAADDQLQQPDYERRLAAFSRANAWLRAGGSVAGACGDQHQVALSSADDRPDERALNMLVHNCIWFIEHEEDMALRDNAAFTLEQVIALLGRLTTASSPAAAAAAAVGRQLLCGSVLPELRRRLRARDDRLRHAAVGLLRAAVLECGGGGGDARLAQLLPLCNTVDTEQDFFANVRHIQLHRRTRAFKRLLELLSSGVLHVRADVLTNYLLPLANAYLFNEQYVKQTGLVDTAIKLAGVAAGRMSWHQYQMLVRHCVRVLPTSSVPRHAVRLLASVLDHFPFHLPSSVTSAAGERPDENMTDTTLPDADEASDDILPELDEAQQQQQHENQPATEAPSSGNNTNTSSRDDRQMALIVEQLNNIIVPALLRAMSPAKIVAGAGGGATTLVDIETQRATRMQLALPVVKLLQRWLPTPALHAHTATVFARVCELLLSRVPSVRQTAVDTLAACVRQLDSASRDGSGGGGVALAVDQLMAVLTVRAAGCQRHVLLRAVDCVLRALPTVPTPGIASGQQQLSATGQLDRCMGKILKLCHMELFEMKPEEKESQLVPGEKVVEARGVKSYHIITVVCRCASASSMFQIVGHLRDWVGECRSARANQRVAECVRQCCIGLADNRQLAVSRLLLLCHGLLSGKISATGANAGGNGDAAADTEQQRGRQQLLAIYNRPDQLLLPNTPGRAGAPTKTGRCADDALLAGLGASLLASLLRRGRVADEEHATMVAPLLTPLADLLLHQDVKLVTACMQCWLMLIKHQQMALSLAPAVTATLRDNLFVVLHKFAAPGLATAAAAGADTFDMVSSTFKVLSGVVRAASTAVPLSVDQLRVLLTHVEHELLPLAEPDCRALCAAAPGADNAAAAGRRRHGSLTLLAAVLTRRYTADELLPAVMQRVASAAVRSGALTDGDACGGGGVSGQCRGLLLRYLLDYPLAPACVEKHVMFVVKQLSYSEPAGRMAALDICHDICRQFPQSVLDRQSCVLLLFLAARLVNETEAACRRRVAGVLGTMMARVSSDTLARLLDMCLLWLNNDAASDGKQRGKLEQQSMAAMLIGCVMSRDSEPCVCERVSHVQRGAMLQSLCQHVQCVAAAPSIKPASDTALDGGDSQLSETQFDATGAAVPITAHCTRETDLFVFQLLRSLLKLITSFDKSLQQLDDDAYHRLWACVQRCLLHRHVWVRLSAGQLLGQLLSHVHAPLVVQLLCGGGAANGGAANGGAARDALPPPRALTSDPGGYVRALSLDLCDQLGSQPLSAQLANQCVKNLVWLARLLVDADLLDEPDRDSTTHTTTDNLHNCSSNSGRRINLRWLVRRLRRHVNAEVVAASGGRRIRRCSGDDDDTARRTAVFHWLAAVSVHLSSLDSEAGGGERLRRMLPVMLPPLVRELNNQQSTDQRPLYVLANEVCELMRGSVGVEMFTAALTHVQQHQAQRKLARRAQRATELLTNPEKSAQLKIKENLRKNETRKRKRLEIKSLGFKRRKTVKIQR